MREPLTRCVIGRVSVRTATTSAREYAHAALPRCATAARVRGARWARLPVRSRRGSADDARLPQLRLRGRGGRQAVRHVLERSRRRGLPVRRSGPAARPSGGGDRASAPRGRPVRRAPVTALPGVRVVPAGAGPRIPARDHDGQAVRPRRQGRRDRAQRRRSAGQLPLARRDGRADRPAAERDQCAASARTWGWCGRPGGGRGGGDPGVPQPRRRAGEPARRAADPWRPRACGWWSPRR